MNQSSDSLKPCALLWDESFLWGLTAFEALKAAGLPFDLVRSEDIRANKLRDYSMIFVPGGWASNKRKALGE
jgi:putative intracellular protease/amidase